jgi:hypothetical protein
MNRIIAEIKHVPATHAIASQTLTFVRRRRSANPALSLRTLISVPK